MSLEVSDNPGAARPVRHVGTLIVGGGFGGLGAAIRLSKNGNSDFLLLERGNEVGGTWRDNTYPGAACDVPSHLYSYSFALNPTWSRSFSRQPEIQRYILEVAERYQVLDKAVFDCEVTSARWNDAATYWEVDSSKGRFTADTMIGAFGGLCEPSLPEIKGIDTFEGHTFHSSRWNHGVDLAGKRVAVIGTGASAIQIVPAIAGTVGHLDVYQRTAPWLLPRFDRPYSAPERFAFRHIPGWQRLSRALIYLFHETQGFSLTKGPAFMKPLELVAKAKLRLEVPDRRLRAKVRPNFRLGCKRMLLSNDYYPALGRDNVDLVTDGIAEIRPNAIVTTDGAVREIDALVVATGFHVTDSPTFRIIHGRDGRSLAEVFDEVGMQAYRGTTVTNFPNAFLLLGPNTATGHTSQVYMIEGQINYTVDAIATMRRLGLKTVEVHREEQDAYNNWIQRSLAKSVWNTGGCKSWYLDKRGHNPTLWPGLTLRFHRLTRKFDIEAYDTSAAVFDVDDNQDTGHKDTEQKATAQ